MNTAKRIGAILGAAAVALGATVPAAMADALFVDGNENQDGFNNWYSPLDLGNICVGTSKASGGANMDLDAKIRRASATTNAFNVFANGATVTVSGPGAGLGAPYGSRVTVTPASTTLPADWYSNTTAWANQFAPETVNPVVTVEAGNRTGLDYVNVEFVASGRGAAGNNYQARRVLQVRWTVVNNASCTQQDSTPPVVDYVLSPETPDGDNGWFVSDAAVRWSISDPESAVSNTSAGCNDAIVNYDTAGEQFTCAATSDGGTTTATTPVIKRDATKPTLTWADTTPANGAEFAYGRVPAVDAWSCVGTDATSGVNADGCAITGYSTEAGTHLLTAKVTDNAGNVTSETRSYTVIPWTVKGFYSPVRMDADFTRVKGGATVPLKFEVFAAGEEITSTTAVGATFAQRTISCETGDPIGLAKPLMTTGGTQFRFDADAGQFIQNWRTPKDAGACYRVIMRTEGGSRTTADFLLK